MARVGIYGGSFNPPHVGHSLAAREMTDRLGLDRLLIVPAAVPPHKALPDGSPGAADRLELCRLAFAGIPKAEVCDLELRREGPSYTIDTLRALRQSLPDDELFLMMGTDMLLSFDLWREPEEIARLATLAVVRREESEAVWDEVRRKAASLSRTLPARIGKPLRAGLLHHRPPPAGAGSALGAGACGRADDPGARLVSLRLRPEKPAL